MSESYDCMEEALASVTPREAKVVRAIVAAFRENRSMASAFREMAADGFGAGYQRFLQIAQKACRKMAGPHRGFLRPLQRDEPWSNPLREFAENPVRHADPVEPEYYGLPVRTRNVLRSEGIHTDAQLLEKVGEGFNFRRLPNCGAMGEREILEHAAHLREKYGIPQAHRSTD